MTLYTFNMLGVFEAEEPIIHTEESIGNIAKIKRLKVMHEGKPYLVPAISGNSFRGQMRDLIADAFVEKVRGTDGKVKMKPDVYSVIFSGGVMKEASDLSDRLESLLEAVPLLRIWGSAFGNMMMPSKVAVAHLIPLTIETQASLKNRVENLTGDHPLIARLNHSLKHLPAAEDITFEEGPLTRKNDLKNPLLLEDVELTESPDPKSSQMIYHVECIASGSLLLHRINSKFPLSEIELGCLLDGLVAFAKTPTVGGRSAAGYGRVNFVYRLSLQPSVGKVEDILLDASLLSGLSTGGEGTLSRALRMYAEDITNRAESIRAALAA